MKRPQLLIWVLKPISTALSRVFQGCVLKSQYFQPLTAYILVPKHSDVQFSHSVMSNSLRTHGLKHARLPCPSPTPRACSNSCSSSWWCHPLVMPTISSSVIPFSSCLQSFPASGSFSNESVLHIRFSFRISLSSEYSGLISFRIDRFDLLAVQGTLTSLLQHHSSKASIHQRSSFFMVQLSHPYMTTWKTIALIRWTFVSKVISFSAF